MKRSQLPLVAAVGLAAIAAPAAVADPPALPALPDVFCFRITDIERWPCDVSDSSFMIEFEVLNWTDRPAGGVLLSANVGGFVAFPGFLPPIPGGPPRLIKCDIDPDGRGGPLGGADIGFGVFDDPAIHSGRGRGDISGHLNDWSLLTGGPTFCLWAGGTPIPNRDLIGAARNDANGNGQPDEAFALVPGLGTDALGDTAIDGGPGPYTPPSPPPPFPTGGPPTPDGSGNVLDGFVIKVCDWDPGETLCFNWFLLDQQLNLLGTTGFGNAFGFGTVCLVRLPVQASPPGPVFFGNSGFNQNPFSFFDSVFFVPGQVTCPDPCVVAQPGGGAEGETPQPDIQFEDTMFALEFGAGVTAPPVNPNDVPDAQPNTGVQPENPQHPCTPAELGGCFTDFNGDGKTDGQDLGALLLGWGPCPPLGGVSGQ